MSDINIDTRNCNYAETIGRTLDSAPEQTIDDRRYEVVVVDGGSTDETTETVSNYMEIHPSVIRIFLYGTFRTDPIAKRGYHTQGHKYVKRLGGLMLSSAASAASRRSSSVSNKRLPSA